MVTLSKVMQGQVPELIHELVFMYKLSVNVTNEELSYVLKHKVAASSSTSGRESEELHKLKVALPQRLVPPCIIKVELERHTQEVPKVVKLKVWRLESVIFRSEVPLSTKELTVRVTPNGMYKVHPSPNVILSRTRSLFTVMILCAFLGKMYI